MFRIASLLLACLAVPAFAALGTQTSRQLQTTIVDLAVATPSLSTLVTALTTADLAGALSDPNATLTVFAPTNDAFGALTDSLHLLDSLLTPAFKMHLQEILLYHVFAATAVLSADLTATQDIEMLNGEMLTVTKTGTEVTVITTAGTTFLVTLADVEGSNGVVHIIDGVLMPSSIGASIIAIGAIYSTLLSLITRAGWDERLLSGPLTLFAPTNTAFEALSADTFAVLTSDEGAAMLSDILIYHVVIGPVTSDMLTDGGMVMTLNQDILTFMVGDTVMVNDATVVDPDMLAFNGVTHGIDKVLMIPVASIVDLAVATPSLSTLVTAVTTADSVDALSDPDPTLTPLTVFAPTNDAFGALPAGLLEALLTPGFKMHLQEILRYHVTGGPLVSSFLAATQEIGMRNGERLNVTKTDTEVTVTTTAGTTFLVTLPDVLGSNGVVHIIDGVLVPSSIGDTVIDIGAGYSTLLSLITLAGLEEILAGGPFTLFAPTNTAFDSDTVAFLTSDEGAAMLSDILTYHVVNGSVTSNMLTDGGMATTVQGQGMATTVQGQMITFMIGDTVMVNDATVVDPDMLAFNGVTHGIDKILMPSDDTMAPSMAPASGGLVLGASFSALFATVLAVAL